MSESSAIIHRRRTVSGAPFQAEQRYSHVLCSPAQPTESQLLTAQKMELRGSAHCNKPGRTRIRGHAFSNP